MDRARRNDRVSVFRRGVLVAGALGLLLAAGTAEAVVSFARRGKMACVIEVKEKAPGVYHIWQSTQAGGNTYEDTGHTVTVGANGSGKKTIPLNAVGTLMIGHNVKIGDANGPNNQEPAVVEPPAMMVSGLVEPGLNGPMVVTVPQAVTWSEHTLLETWKPNSTFMLALDPGAGSWVNMGCAVQGQGDLQVQLLQFTPQQIVFRVVADPTSTTIDNVLISGVGMQIIAPIGGNVGLHLGYNGSTDVILNGEFLQTVTGAGSYLYQRAKVVPNALCYADCNGDTLLDIADFGCFMTTFAIGNHYSDCNSDGNLDLADFGCFQTSFAVGCP